MAKIIDQYSKEAKVFNKGHRCTSVVDPMVKKIGIVEYALENWHIEEIPGVKKQVGKWRLWKEVQQMVMTVLLVC